MSSPFPDPAPRALRLDLALEAGLSLPASGPIAIFHPQRGEDLGDAQRADTLIVTPHAADHAWFSAMGLTCVQRLEQRVAAAMVCLPRSRVEGRDLIAQAASLCDGPLIIDGQKTDGVDTMLRDLRAVTPLSDSIAKGHGKIAWADAMPDLVGWRAQPQTLTEGGLQFQTLPGVFSADGIDAGSALLADALPAGLKGVAVDLGAGWGYLSARLLGACPSLSALHLIESDARALDSARAVITDPRAQFHWADATQPVLRDRVDVVITNPPFHTGRSAQPQLGMAFITAAAALLKPSGQLFLVANRHLPYERALSERFRTVTEIGGTSAFKVFLAQGPVAAAAPAAAKTRLRTRSGRRA